MCDNCKCKDYNLYTDKNGKIICENDIVLFDNGHYYRCVIYNSMYCLKCLSIDIPLLELGKICIGKQLSSGCILTNFRIISQYIE